MLHSRLGLLIRSRRESMGLSQGEIAKQVGVHRSYVSLIEGGRVTEVSRDILLGFSRVLDIPIEQLLQAAGYLPQPREKPPVRTPQQIVQELEANIPLLLPLPRQSAPAGEGSYLDVEYVPYMPAPEERRHNFAPILVTGDSMEPRIHQGHIMIIDKSASPRPGNVVVAIVDGEVMVKELREKNGRLMLISLQGHAPVEVTEETRILGVGKMGMYRL